MTGQKVLTAEQKNILSDIIAKVAGILSVHLSSMFVKDIIEQSYQKGLSDAEVSIKPDVNLSPNNKAIEFLSNYTFQNIKDVNDDTVKKLRKELGEGMMRGESTTQLSMRVKDVMNVSMTRAKAIARTETHRAYNFGAAYGAKQSGIKLKKYAYNPHPQSDICQHVANKAPIALDEDFVYGGESWQSPPFHVNCRSRLLFERDES